MSTGVAPESGSANEQAPVDAKNILRVAAFIVSAHGDNAVKHALRLEAASVVPDIARRVRIEVERLVQAPTSIGEMHLASSGVSESRS